MCGFGRSVPACVAHSWERPSPAALANSQIFTCSEKKNITKFDHPRARFNSRLHGLKCTQSTRSRTSSGLVDGGGRSCAIHAARNSEICPKRRERFSKLPIHVSAYYMIEHSRFGATALVARMASDGLALEYLRRGDAMRATNAVVPKFAAAAGEASSSGTSKAFVPMEVPPLPARRSAMPPCRLPNTVPFSSFSCLRHTKDSWRGRHVGNPPSINSKSLPK